MKDEAFFSLPLFLSAWMVIDNRNLGNIQLQAMLKELTKGRSHTFNIYLDNKIRSKIQNFKQKTFYNYTLIDHWHTQKF